MLRVISPYVTPDDIDKEEMGGCHFTATLRYSGGALALRIKLSNFWVSCTWMKKRATSEQSELAPCL